MIYPGPAGQWSKISLLCFDRNYFMFLVIQAVEVETYCLRDIIPYIPNEAAEIHI